MNDLQFAMRYQCLPIRCSGCLVSLQNELYTFAKTNCFKSMVKDAVYGRFQGTKSIHTFMCLTMKLVMRKKVACI
jgi:hypothetical protein